MAKMIIKEIQCKSAIGKCGFPGGGLAINPYVGCGHDCQYCYARFMKRFTNHTESWGSFVDVKSNIAEVLAKQLRKLKDKDSVIYVGTVTDPYQPMEKDYQLTRKILEILANVENPVSLLTKSDLILRDLDLLKKFKEVDVSFTINTLDEKWASLVEPGAPAISKRLAAARQLSENNIPVYAMMGPFWPVFTDPTVLFAEFKKSGIKKVFSESFNAVGGNWTGVENVLEKNYPQEFMTIKEIVFNKEKFDQFHQQAKNKIEQLGIKYGMLTDIYFAQGHAANKFRK